jgi:O-methyltransferase domain/Dimerisation domain
MQPSPSIPPYVAMLEMLLAQWNSAAISAAARLGVADHLESGPKTTKDLASLLNLHEDSLYRVLRALAGLGIFHEGENRTFSQTPLSGVLRSNATPSLRYAADMLIDDWQFRSVQAICSTIENGRAAMANVFGADLFEYLQAHPDQAFRFNRGMTDLSSGDAPAVVASYDFSGFKHIVDIAGGAGGLLAAILANAPHPRGTLFDMPSVIDQAKRTGFSRRFHPAASW